MDHAKAPAEAATRENGEIADLLNRLRSPSGIGEPSDHAAMRDAGATFIWGGSREKAVECAKEDKFDSCAFEAESVYAAMIDTALKE